MAGIDTSFMTDPQLTWYRKLVKRDPKSWTADQRTFMDKMARQARDIQEAREQRADREIHQMIDDQWGRTHPSIDEPEGWEMENPGVERR
jgi:hypothetical protein